MALSTILAVGVGLIAVGALSYYPATSGGLSWVVGGIVTIIVGYATKNMK